MCAFFGHIVDLLPQSLDLKLLELNDSLCFIVKVQTLDFVTGIAPGC